MKRQGITLKPALVFAVIILAVAVTYALPNPKQDPNVTIRVNLQEVEIIMKGLGKLPLDESGNLYFNIQRQVNAQLQQESSQLKVEPKTSKDTTSKKKQ